jgi:cytochrome P450
LATLVELAVLALASWPALRLLSIPPIRREYAGIAWSLVGVLVLYASVIGGIALFAPVLLHPLSAVAAAALLAERWRARPSYGAAHGLPPGRLALFPRGPWVNDRFYLEAAQRWGPVFKTSLQYRPCVAVLGAGLGAELLRGHPNDLEAPRVRFNRFIPKGFLRYMEPENHRSYKPSFRTALASNVLQQNGPVLQEIVRSGLERLTQESARHPGVGLAPRPPLREIVFELLVASFFALRSDAHDFAWLQARYEDLDLRKLSLTPDSRDRTALAEVEAWVRGRGRALQEATEQGADSPSCFLATLLQAHPGFLTDETALGNLVYVLTIARADLTALLIWVLKLLGDAPEWAERLREVARTKSASEAHALAWCIVRETLRLEQSEYVYRRAKREIQFRGFTIPRNWRVRVLIREGHRDPELFPNPECFDPSRWLGPEKPGAHFQPFGLDAHACPGAPLTEALTCLILTEFGRANDWQVVSDGPREYGWAHWQPSSKLRLVVTPAASVPTGVANSD